MVTITDGKSQDSTQLHDMAQSVNVDAELATIEEHPPAYSESTISGSASGSEYATGPPEASSSSAERTTLAIPTRVALTPPTNFLTIERKNDSVKGTHAINPTLPPPPGSVISTDSDGKNLNLNFASTNGSINAVVEIIKGVDNKGPAHLQAESKNGSVALVIHDAQQNRFRLRVASANGSITLRIPQTYTGTISTKMKNGSLKFDSKLQTNLHTFSVVGEESRFFLGDYISAGYENDETWLMDHIRVEAHNGGVKIAFIEEDGGKGKEACGKGFFSRLLG
ncbi:hypothetical protein M422DRAFT_31345 [Sphaerobolus stellatus SS14]|uniref:DUF7330 domain-containing protein n=1 Tax=Sphaerobolus stellatus (strain SS14) TaxID=990650 RepID=A0A0C9VL58_SPHS4|nr:hypothetical protein M422DRAFT_31345 [Sphaerobolus stellatus SS14]